MQRQQKKQIGGGTEWRWVIKASDTANLNIVDPHFKGKFTHCSEQPWKRCRDSADLTWTLHTTPTRGKPAATLDVGVFATRNFAVVSDPCWIEHSTVA
jgi:hypothetical protein